MIPVPHATEATLTPLLTSAGLARLSSTGWIRITGEDRVRWLNGMSTNSIQALTPGQGCYNFFLSAQGRIQADATAFLTPDAILLETDCHRIEDMIALLDRVIIMDDVELTDLNRQRYGLLLAGPHAESILTQFDLPIAPHAPIRLQTVTWDDPLFGGVDIIHAHSPLVPRYELWTESETTAAAITAALLSAGAHKSSAADLEQLRILEGTALFGTDIRDRDLPQETAFPGQPSRALHFAKGCYLGQEIVERIRSRGNVHRTFTGFRLTGELPASGTLLFTADAPDKSIGELTSVARIELDGHPVQLGLGYLRREVLDNPARAAAITYPGGSALPITLPFRT
jgi:aminomethyltransferase